jgi:hypothetical protein
MRRLPSLRRLSFLGPAALLALLGSLPLAAQESPIEKAATGGGIRILTGETAAPSGTPDLVRFKHGRVAEVWNLSVQGDRVTFLSRDERLGWREEAHSKTKIRAIEPGRSLDELRREQAQLLLQAPPKITAAEKRPTPKQEILAGRFIAKQGDHTRWSFRFTHEHHKYYTHAEDATEYGQFLLRSYRFETNGDRVLTESEVVAKGKYFLYAPGAIGNDDWVLNLSSVVYIENDIEPQKTYFSERLPDEVFLVKFAPDGKVFHLAWANHSGWQWTAPVEQTFYRSGTSPAVPASTLFASRPLSGASKGVPAAAKAPAGAARPALARKEDSGVED